MMNMLGAMSVPDPGMSMTLFAPTMSQHGKTTKRSKEASTLHAQAMTFLPPIAMPKVRVAGEAG